MKLYYANFKCSYQDGSKTAEIEAESFEEAAEAFSRMHHL